MNMLVLNCGSSSIQYQLLDMKEEPVLLAKRLVEKIGLPKGIFKHKPTVKSDFEVAAAIADNTVV